MAHRDGSDWLQLGGTILTLGGGLGGAYWIYVLESAGDARFWQWPAYIASALVALGIALISVWFFKPNRRKSDGSTATMQQTGGAGSTNIQAGRDIRLDLPKGRDT